MTAAGVVAAPHKPTNDRDRLVARAFESGLAGALLGGPRCAPELASCMGMPEDALASLLTDAQRSGLVRAVEGPVRGKQPAFVWTGPYPAEVAAGRAPLPSARVPAVSGPRAPGGDQAGPFFDGFGGSKSGAMSSGYINGGPYGWPPMVPYLQPMPYMYPVQPGFFPGAQTGGYNNLTPSREVRDSSGGKGGYGHHQHHPVGLRGFAGGEPAAVPSTGWGGVPLSSLPHPPSSPSSGTSNGQSSGGEGSGSDKAGEGKLNGKGGDGGSDGGRTNCAFFLKTGTCAYGDKCKFEHPLDRVPVVRFNSCGLPIRPGEPDCAFFVKNLRCGFGASCKFNHPEPYMPYPMAPGAMQMHQAAMMSYWGYQQAYSQMAGTAAMGNGMVVSGPSGSSTMLQLPAVSQLTEQPVSKANSVGDESMITAVADDDVRTGDGSTERLESTAESRAAGALSPSSNNSADSAAPESSQVTHSKQASSSRSGRRKKALNGTAAGRSRQSMAAIARAGAGSGAPVVPVTVPQPVPV